MTSSDIFPWLKNQWQKLNEAYQNKRLPHAFLWQGAEGLGKKQLAHQFAQLLMCFKGTRCEKCQSCHLFQAKTHPDFLSVEPQEGSIKIDQIRQVVQFVQKTPMISAYRVIIISPASAMNLNAANALLKTLEEPASNTILILIENMHMRLPATIQSRCQKMFFTVPSENLISEWLYSQTRIQDKDAVKFILQLKADAPLKALDLLKSNFIKLRNTFFDGMMALSCGKEDPLKIASFWQEEEIKTVLFLFLSLLQDILRLKYSMPPVNEDYKEQFKKIALTSAQVFLLYDLIKARLTKVLERQNLNRQLLLEELFIHWTMPYVSR